MANQHPDFLGNITRTALLFEGGLGVLAVGIGLTVGLPPWQTIDLSARAWPQLAEATGWGSLAAVPMLVGMWLSIRFPIGPLARLQRLVREQIVPLFRDTPVWQLALISAVAGVGEELLFRGLLQDGLARLIGPPTGVWAAVVVTGLLFGAVHWLSTTYAVLAAAIGIYLGWLFVATGNLAAPIATHAVYDFIALVYLVKVRQETAKGGPTP